MSLRRVAWVALLAVAAGCASSSRTAEGEGGEDGSAGDGVRVIVEGNERVATRDLIAEARRELASFREHRRKADAADAAWAMEMLLRANGFAHGGVAFALTEDGVRFTVTEGPRAYLGELHLDVGDELDLAPLKEFFRTGGTGLFGEGRPLFRRSQMEGAAGELERWLLLQGYLEVEVDPIQVEFSEGDTIAVVTVTARPGRRFTVSDIEWDGIDPAEIGFTSAGKRTEDGATWFELLREDVVGGPFHARVPVELAARVRGALLERGYQFAQVSGDARIDYDIASAVVVIHADPGPVVRLDAVEFTGLDRTRESFVRRRIPIYPGEPLLQELLDEGLDELYRTQLFGAVRSRLVRKGEDLADLHVELDELKSRSISTFLGYGSYEQLILNPRYRNENLFGIGRRFELSLRGSLKSQGIEARVEDPWLFGRKNVIETSGSYELRQEPSFDLEAIKLGISWRHHFSSIWRLRAEYAFRAQNARNVTGDIPDAEEEGFIRTSGIDFSLRRDHRDSALLPTTGSILELGSFWSSPSLGADLNFLGFRFSAADHLKLGSRGVLALGGTLKAIEILDDRETLPIQERLFLGGESTVRSFGRDELGPVSLDGSPAGGLTSVVATIEYRHRIWRDLHAAAFYDIGMVDPRSWTFGSKWGHAIGVGLRYYLPVGPVRLDFGYNPGELFAADRRWALHFAFGFTF